MLGFAAVDRRSETVAIWLVSRTDPTEASSTNAVVVDLADEHALKKVHSLTRERVVITTPGSDLTGLPISDGHPTALLGEFIDATRTHQRAIVEAVRSYAASRKGQKLVEPTFPAEPQLPENWPETCQDRALELAGLVGRAWTNWLVSDGERLRRTTSHAPAGPRGSCPGSSTSRSCWPCHLPWRRSFALNPWGPSPAERSRPQPSSTGGSGAYHVDVCEKDAGVHVFLPS